MKSSKAIVPVLAMAFAVAQAGLRAAGPQSAGASSAAGAMSSSTGGASAKGASAEIQQGTKISAALASNVDARQAKPGDKVVARVTKNVKQHGRTVIHKGDKLIGHVTKVQAGAAANAGSSVAVAFDQLVQGNSTTQLNTVLTSILPAPRRDNDSGLEPMEAPMAGPVAAPSGRGGGGLLGGVGSTVNSAVGATTGAAGAAAGGVGSTLGASSQAALGSNSALNLNTPARQIHLESQASADQSLGMNSVLSTRRGDLRLESGTQMQFRVAASSQAPKP